MDKLLVSIRKELQTSALDYLVLFTGSILFLLLLKLFQGERLTNFVIILGFVIFYIVWGIFHHSNEKSLNFRSVIEYVLIGMTIFLLLTIVFT